VSASADRVDEEVDLWRETDAGTKTDGWTLGAVWRRFVQVADFGAAR
jgi:hypothetical protein